MNRKLMVSIVALTILGLMIAAGGVGQKLQAKMFGTSEALVKSIEQIFAINDQWAMDAEPFPDWGPYWCAHFTKGKGTMVHFAKDPSRDDADVVLTVQAEALIEKAGLNPEVFPQLTEYPFGPGLTSGQWYYIPKLKLLMLPMSAEEIGMKGDLVPKI